MAIIHRGHSSPAVSWNPVFPYYGLGWLSSRGVYMALFSLCFLAWLVVGFLSWIWSVQATVFLMGLGATTSALERGNS
jgi:hypothetical protein